MCWFIYHIDLMGAFSSGDLWQNPVVRYNAGTTVVSKRHPV